MRGYLKFLDRFGVQSTIPLLGFDPADTNVKTRLSSFITAIRPYTNAAITEYGVSVPEIQAIVGENTALDAFASSMHKGIYRFSYVANNEKKSVSLYIPAPNVDGFDLLPEVGYRANTGSGNDIAAALATATGIADLTFDNGVLEHIDGESSRPSDGAYILFKDEYGRQQYMGVPNVTDLAALATFCSALFQGTSDYTNAAPIEIGIFTPDIATRTDPGAETEQGFDSVEGRAVMKFGYTLVVGGNIKKKVSTFTFPAAKSAVFYNTDDKSPVDRTVGDTIAAAMTTLYGGDLRKYQRGRREWDNLG
ncbi:MAG: hypothetical protein PVH19_00095 [Planctomycetia bacterium]|jgi:hypothetical protein